MKRTYRPEELEKILEVENHTLYTWLRYAVPEHLKPKRAHNEELGRKVYQFTEKEKLILFQVKELKQQGLTYAEIKIRLKSPKKISTPIKQDVEEKEEKEDKTYTSGELFILENTLTNKLELSIGVALGIHTIIFIMTIFILYKIARG